MSDQARPRIGDYALLGDGHGAALVDRAGSIDWWCAPRFDSRSSFARLLDPDAGHWSIRPAGEFEVERRYVPGTMVLATTFRTPAGVVELSDALALAHGARGHDIGLESPHTLIRGLRALEGEVRIEVELRPRLEYGLVAPQLVARPGGIESVGGPDTLALSADRELEIHGDHAIGELVLRAGETAAFSLRHRVGMSPDPKAPVDARTALADTTAAWRSWSDAHQGYDGPYREQVRRSALVLQALTYQPTGAVVAAPTTSLPEEPGGSANWDYRYAWLRDASLTLDALWVAACPHEAGRYFDWMARAAVGSGADEHVQIMFGVQGERDLTEHSLEHLRGYRESRPVRVGNDAWKQKQLDIFGEVLDGAWRLREQLGDLEPLTAAFLIRLADRAAASWREPDAGIWEGRDGERHYTTSKLMCWVALDRAVKLASRLGAEHRTGDWTSERDAVREAILGEAWDDSVGAYTGALGSDHLDAGVLLMPLMGFLPAGDERMRSTIEAIADRLGEGGLVRRWTGAQGEGAFIICSFWLADCLARAGEPDRAREVFERIVAHANDVGLLAEEIDTADGQLIGNFPQGLSHIGLINAAWSIEKASSRPSPPPGERPQR